MYNPCLRLMWLYIASVFEGVTHRTPVHSGKTFKVYCYFVGPQEVVGVLLKVYVK